ncbi:hypothetical protein SAMN06265795_103241 [Noviherbaspirillum humi]|uniref:ASCH domain-containing protein n=2 Tax=Noviherbaspirillum humi TaxID=1688639 RepID=A0A239F9V6_9BURK|nr:hypothetical protein SAMN06265795_103241 [Noviherbaspirillum humi]
MVRALLAGTKTQTRRIVKPQPLPHGTGWRTRWRNAEIFWEDAEAAQAVDRNPYGSAGDSLWVKETWRPVPGAKDDPMQVRYRADGEAPADEGAWRSSLFMPRWASRITLAIVEVRVERLNRISEADALAEGMSVSPATQAYRAQWEAMHGPNSWAQNPWVWVVEFEPPVRAVGAAA